MGAISKAVGGITKGLLGSGDQTTTSSLDISKATPEEIALLKKLLAAADTSNSPTAGAEGDLAAAFKQNLAQYLGSSYGEPTPEIMQRATEYVDQTFTNPAQASFDKFQREYTAKANEQAAALGRQPMDSAIQQQNFRTLADINAQMGAERGSRLAQRADELAYQRPQDKLSYINNLNQQAFQNRNQLLNMQSGLYKGMQDYRLASAGKSTTQGGQDLGLLGNLGSLAQGYNAVGGIVSGKGGSGSSLSKLFG